MRAEYLSQVLSDGDMDELLNVVNLIIEDTKNNELLSEKFIFLHLNSSE
ncbi:MAG: hypothetical protein NTZ60_03550 [Campylobacterales bacterium]|nr:hypothetical protein [Campylobacterales bacterium]